MPRWVAALDRVVDKALGRKATLAYRLARPWYERPVYYKGNRMNVIGDGACVTIPHYTKAFDWELEFGIFLCRQGSDIRKEKARDFIGGFPNLHPIFSPHRQTDKKEGGGPAAHGKEIGRLTANGRETRSPPRNA